MVDAVEAAVRSMELDQYFNAGYGAVLTSEGNVEMDACIMNGKTMEVGAVTKVCDILHPISLARSVMEKIPYNFLGGEGAMKFAKEHGFQILPPGSLVSTYAKESLLEWKRRQVNGMNNTLLTVGEVGTVGAVAIDKDGNIAAATSTGDDLNYFLFFIIISSYLLKGGLTGKMPSRVGDTPIVGAGTYSDNNIGGISATGTGESIMKAVLVFDILKRMEYLNEDIQTASDTVNQRMKERFPGDGGTIAIDKKGNVGISFTSNRMAWAYQKENTIYYGINKGDYYEEKVKLNEV